MHTMGKLVLLLELLAPLSADAQVGLPKGVESGVPSCNTHLGPASRGFVRSLVVNTIFNYVILKRGGAQEKSIFEVVKGVHSSNAIDATLGCTFSIHVRKADNSLVKVCSWTVMVKVVKKDGVERPALDWKNTRLPNLNDCGIH